MNRVLLSIAAAVFTVVNLFSQDLVTDRPDFTESAVSVKAGMIQVETGVERVEFGKFEELTYPNTLFRIGAGHNLELRVGFPGWSNLSAGNNSESFLNDMDLGLKYQIAEDGADTEMALILSSTIPTGDDEVSNDSPEFAAIFAAAMGVNDQLDLGANLGVVSTEAADERELSFLTSAAVGIGINDELGAFVEVLAEIPQDAPWAPVFDGGFTYLVTQAAQADLYVGVGLNDYAPDLILGAGFSFRFDY